MRRNAALAILIGIALVVPTVARAQQAQASIAGVVKDASGGVLPGVTVEVASPVLTEKVRTSVTDGTGQYRVVGLPPGTYTVTFGLTGFNTVKRDGIELTGTFTATVDADLRVGSLQETVTVTGETPVVDVQSARRQSVIDGDVLKSIPTSRSYNNVLQLVPGVDPGTAQVQLSPTMLLFTAHGGSSQDGRLTVDGINTGASRGGSGVSGYIPDMQNTQEVAFSISGNLGEAETGGPQMSIVPKSGGNSFTGSFFATGISQGLQGSNFTTRLQAAGLTAPAKILHLFDVQASVGGPIKKDRLWFFYNFRTVGRGDAQPGIFANKNAGRPDEVDLRTRFQPPGPQRHRPADQLAATDVADYASQQVQRVPRRSASLSGRGVDRRVGRLPDHRSRRRMGRGRKPGQRILWRRAEFSGDRRLSVQPAACSASQMAVARHQPASARGRRRHLRVPLGLRRAAGQSDPRPHSCAGAGDDPGDRALQPEVPLIELAERTDRRPYVGSLGQLCHGRAQPQGRLPGGVPPRYRQPVHHHHQHGAARRTDSTTACRISSRWMPDRGPVRSGPSTPRSTRRTAGLAIG